MNEYLVRLHDNRRITIFAYSRADIPEALDAEGIDRDEVAGVRLIEKKSEIAVGNIPYVEQRDAA
jgi:hypothetical protein